MSLITRPTNITQLQVGCNVLLARYGADGTQVPPRENHESNPFAMNGQNASAFWGGYDVKAASLAVTESVWVRIPLISPKCIINKGEV